MRDNISANKIKSALSASQKAAVTSNESWMWLDNLDRGVDLIDRDNGSFNSKPIYPTGICWTYLPFLPQDMANRSAWVYIVTIQRHLICTYVLLVQVPC